MKFIQVFWQLIADPRSVVLFFLVLSLQGRLSLNIKTNNKLRPGNILVSTIFICFKLETLSSALKRQYNRQETGKNFIMPCLFETRSRNACHIGGISPCFVSDNR